MNPVIQAQVSEFSENFSLQARSTSDQFEVYSIYAILNGALGESIDPTDAHLIGAEFGLDGVAILVQGRLVVDSETACEALDDVINPKIDFYFFQSKTSTSYDYGDASKFFDSIKGFFNDGMKGESVQLDDLIAAKEVLYKNGVHRRNPGIHAYYITTGNYDHPPRIESLIEATKLQLSDTNIFENTDISIEMIGAKNLQRHYRAASSSVEVTIEFPRNAVMPAHNLVNEAYIGYIKAEELIKIVSIKDESGKPTEINKSVFFDNIRDFDPDSDINLEISRTLANGEASDFVFRNNGITVVSKIIKRIGDNFKIEDYQVVNGCQTSNIIFHNRDHTNEAHIPIRIIGTNNDEFISSIIIGTNRQNAVREEQFWALKPFMKNFEEYCRSLQDDHRLFFERRENQFRGQKIEKARVLQPSILMKAVGATLLGQRNRSSRDYKGIYK